jgi:ribosomal-protein-alanine N-acetyltransferase
MLMPTLGTERLHIREFTLDDLPYIFLIPEGDERLEWLEWNVANPCQLARLYQPSYGNRAVTLRETGEIIGVVGLVPAWGPFHTLPSRRRVGDPAAQLNSPLARSAYGESSLQRSMTTTVPRH